MGAAGGGPAEAPTAGAGDELDGVAEDEEAVAGDEALLVEGRAEVAAAGGATWVVVVTGAELADADPEEGADEDGVVLPAVVDELVAGAWTVAGWVVTVVVVALGADVPVGCTDMSAVVDAEVEPTLDPDDTAVDPEVTVGDEAVPDPLEPTVVPVPDGEQAASNWPAHGPFVQVREMT